MKFSIRFEARWQWMCWTVANVFSSCSPFGANLSNRFYYTSDPRQQQFAASTATAAKSSKERVLLLSSLASNPKFKLIFHTNATKICRDAIPIVVWNCNPFKPNSRSNKNHNEINDEQEGKNFQNENWHSLTRNVVYTLIHLKHCLRFYCNFYSFWIIFKNFFKNGLTATVIYKYWNEVHSIGP